MSAERRKELIRSIRPDKANFQHIVNSPEQAINGSLYGNIDKIMYEYAQEMLQDCYRQKLNLQARIKELEASAITPSFKGA